MLTLNRRERRTHAEKTATSGRGSWPKTRAWNSMRKSSRRRRLARKRSDAGIGRRREKRGRRGSSRIESILGMWKRQMASQFDSKRFGVLNPPSDENVMLAVCTAVKRFGTPSTTFPCPLFSSETFIILSPSTRSDQPTKWRGNPGLPHKYLM